MPETRRELILVGGGHSHVQVLRMLAMSPLPGFSVTVVLDHPVAVYSGMVPGLIAGRYAPHEVEIDVRPLARRAGCRVVMARAVAVDPVGRRVHLEGRPPLPYDLCSLNVGSTVAGLDLPGVRQHALPTRPIARFVHLLSASIDRLRPLDRPARVAVVGAGAAGVEVAFCLQQRLSVALARPPQVLLLGASPSPLPGQGPRAQRALAALAAERGIQLRLAERVAALTADGLVLDDGRTLAADLVPWVTGAAAPPWLARGLPDLPPLPCDDRGFVQIDDDLQVTGCRGLFAVGDCAVLRSWPEIPKAGVFAVREGPVLWANLQAAAAGGRLENYRPQRDFLTLLNLGDGRALGLRNGLAFSGAWVMALKDRIDRRFMARFQVLDSEGGADTDYGRQMPVMDESAMVCGGCAAKVGQDPLAGALGRLGARPDPDLVLGLERPDDVAALRRGGELLVTSIDAFPAFMDDPWLVGRVAAHNALSDLLAKGVAPRLALALVSVPEDADAEELLFQVLSGIRGVLDAAGVSLAGGHSTVGPRLEVGLSITGFCPDDGRLMTKAGLQPGDRLVLTRPLGTGVLLHADMAGRAAGPWITPLIAGMTQGNGRAAAIARDRGVLAATDVTGFGLAGHAAELSRASGLPLHLNLSALPALPGALALLRQGERSTFHEQNRRGLRGIELARPPATPEEAARLELVFDPQTAGGLLLGVPARQLDALIGALHQAGIGDATPIGYAGADRSARPPLHLEWDF